METDSEHQSNDMTNLNPAVNTTVNPTPTAIENVPSDTTGTPSVEPRPTTLLANKLPLLPKTLAQMPLNPSSGTPSPSRDVIPWRIVLNIGNYVPTAVGLEIIDTIMIGRADNTVGYAPQIDLTAYGAVEAGVSRRHAKMFVQDGALYVQDSASTNGTRVNGFQLAPEVPHRLADGDVIEVGELRMKLNFLRIGS
jgi:pSer/pThr/pTyr-binding forkhead associated (FHA) protein